MIKTHHKAFGILITFLFVIIFHAAAASADWPFELADDQKRFSNFNHRAIAVENNTGYPHIVYGGDFLYHAWYDGTQWQYEIIDSSVLVGEYASIAIDSNNALHVGYYDSANGSLKYATNASGVWVISTVDTVGGSNISIVVDSNDKVHIGYWNGSIRYATNVSGTWVLSTIAVDVRTYFSLAVDSNNKVHISYHSGHTYDLRYTTNASGSWETVTVDSLAQGFIGEYNSIAVDSNGKVHISYVGNGNGPGYPNGLKYATNISGSWITSSIDPNATGYTSIAVDDSNKIHISYVGSGLRYATNVSGAWVTSVIDAGEELYTSIATDSDNHAHISYFDDTSEELKYADNTSGTWSAAIIDSTRNITFSSIAIDSADKVHICYSTSLISYGTITGYLKHATDATGIWVSTVVDSVGDVGASCSLAIDTNDKTHISYYDRTNETLKYATDVSGSWVTSTIDSRGYPRFGHGISIATDLNNKAHISYYDDTNNDLKYATNASGSWVTSTIDSAGTVGKGSSIAADSSNKVHICYEGGGVNYDFKYATNVSGSWVVTVIDSVGYSGGSCSLTIDSNDKIHISYYNASNDELKYATNASGSWILSPILTEYNVGSTSIALDSDNRVHISYYNYSPYVKYATNASGSWVTSDIDTSGRTGGFNSIALDSNGNVHISSSNPDLYYITSPILDKDGDGYLSDIDCDDYDYLEHPDQTWYLDSDNDGYSEGTVNNSSCERPLGYKASSELSDISGDCDDGNAALNPETLWYLDADGDGFGNSSVYVQQCLQFLDYVLNDNDCDDSDANIYPGGPQVRIVDSPYLYFDTLQEAYLAASTSSTDTIQLKGTRPESVNFNLNKSVIIDGGYNCSFTKTQVTIFYGSIVITDGVATIGDVDLR